MILDSTTDALEIILDKTVTSELDFVTYYTDYTSTTVTPTSSYGTTNSTSSINLIPPPLTNHQHQLKYCAINNVGNQDVGTKIRFNDSGSYRNISYIFLRVSESIQYSEESGWRVYDSLGNERISGFNRMPPSIRMPEYFGSTTVASYATVALTNGTAFCEYLGKADRPYSSINVRYKVTTAITSTIAWAEIGIYRVSSFIMNETSSFERLGYVDTSTIWNGLGTYTTNISTPNMAIGDDLFVVFSNSTTGTVTSFRAGVANNLNAGVYQTSANTQLSQTSSFSGTLNSSTAIIWTAWEGIYQGI
jgi:hypothetical protein